MTFPCLLIIIIINNYDPFRAFPLIWSWTRVELIDWAFFFFIRVHNIFLTLLHHQQKSHSTWKEKYYIIILCLYFKQIKKSVKWGLFVLNSTLKVDYSFFLVNVYQDIIIKPFQWEVSNLNRVEWLPPHPMILLVWLLVANNWKGRGVFFSFVYCRSEVFCWSWVDRYQ